MNSQNSRLLAICLSFFVILAFLLVPSKKEKRNTVIIGFAGDVMLGRLVNEKLKETNPAYPWGNMLPLLRKNDLNIINLENAITAHEKRIPKIFNFKTDLQNVQTLLEGNIQVVSLANNHTLDFGYEGLYETLEALKKAKIQYVGAGKDIQEAQKAAIIYKNDISIGIIGFTDNEAEWIATDKKPGTNYIKVGAIDNVKESINQVRNKVDLLIATVHWGPNMRERPTKEFIEFAHAIINAGVDIIHGHSAHIFQGIEIYNNKLILYDTGDFVDDYMVDTKLRNDLSFLYQVEVTKDGIKKLELIPTRIDNMQVNKATGTDAAWALERIQKLSAEFGTTISDQGTWRDKVRSW